MSGSTELAAQAHQASPPAVAINLSARALGLVVAGITFLAYSGTLGYEFVYDDRGQIVNNPYLGSWHYLPRYFTDHVWGHVDPTMLGNYYRPLFLVWLWLNQALFGLKPSWWHLTTLLAHVGVTFMVVMLARRLLKSMPAAVIAGLVFGLHPAHVESVAWVSGITDPLLALFLLASFWFYLSWRETESAETDEASRPAFYQRRSMRLAVSLAFFVLAMLSKETALIMPALVFGVEWVCGDGSPIKRAAAAARPAMLYAALIIPYLAVRSTVLKGLGHQLSPVSALTTAQTWPAALWFYCTHLVWPANLSCFYDLAFVTQPSLTNFLLPLVGLIVVAGAVWFLSRRLARETRRRVAVALLWLVLPLLPVLNLSVFAGGELVHDRYLYLPTLGLALLAGLTLSGLQSRARLFGQPALQVAAVSALVLMLGFSTVNQHQYWASELLLFQHGLTVAPDSRIAKTGLANTLSERGYYDTAVGMYNEVIERYPTNWKAINNLGCTYLTMGRFNDAEAALRRGIEVKPSEPRQYISLSVVLQELNRVEESERAARYALSLDENGFGFHYQLGDVLEMQGRLAEALEAYRQEVARHPNFTQARERVEALQSRTVSPSKGAAVNP